MKKKLSPFYIVYFSVLAVLIVALFVAIYFLKGYLTKYEASQPIHKAEQVIDEYFKADDKNMLLAKSTYVIPKYSSVLEVVSYLDEVIDNDSINCYSISSGDENTASYAVTSKDLKIATITLSAIETDGIKNYELDSINLTIGGSNSAKIKAPEGYTVYVNNVPLSEENLTEEREESESCKHMYEGTDGIVYVTYKIDGLFSEPKITAKDKNGNSVSGAPADSENTVYNVPLYYADVTEDIKSDVLSAAEAYAAYMQNDAAFTKIARYVDRKSNLYENLRKSETMWVIDHNGYSIDNPEVSELYYYDENTFSCRIKFVHVLHRRGADDYENNFDMTFYYRNVGGNFLIYDSQVN